MYNEQMNWWGTASPNLTLPDNLETILARADAKSVVGQALGFRIADFLALAALGMQNRTLAAYRNET